MRVTIQYKSSSQEFEFDGDISVSDVKALCGIDFNITHSFALLNGNNDLDETRSLAHNGIKDNSTLTLVPIDDRFEILRKQLQSSDLHGQVHPDILANINKPYKFSQLVRQMEQQQQQMERQKAEEYRKLHQDPFDVEAQKKIEEIIRQEAIMENWQNAIEHNPEAFANVTMLYIPAEVNGVKLKAFIDSGAQMSIMSPECADRCNITRLIDTRYKGTALGVGQANILGRVHGAQIKMGDKFLNCSFSVIEGKSMDLLIGLDMLKRHQMCIDLEKNVLRFHNVNVSFLGEADLPKEAPTEEVFQYQKQLEQLVSMGFPEAEARFALLNTKGNIDEAAGLLS